MIWFSFLLYKLIATHFLNQPELYLRQGVHLIDMHTQYPKIEENNEISKVLSAK
jgi:hypothetical protein